MTPLSRGRRSRSFAREPPALDTPAIRTSSTFGGSIGGLAASPRGRARWACESGVRVRERVPVPRERRPALLPGHAGAQPRSGTASRAEWHGHNAPTPVSATHVSCGALFGIGTVTRQARWGTIASILGAWVTTLPLGAILGAMSYWAIRSV